MDSNTVDNVTPPPIVATGSNVGVLEDAQALWHELLGLSHDRLHLAGLETRRAGLSLVNMVMVGVLAAGLLCSAWMGLLVAAVLGLIENGFMVSSAILFAVALNLMLALFFCRVIHHKSHWLQFPATLRSFGNKSPGHGR